MTKKKLSWLLLPLLLLMLPVNGCQYWDNMTNSGSGSSSNTSSTSTTQAEQPAHGQATVNLMEQTPFNGQDLDSGYWSKLEGYCKAGPTHLIIADMNQVTGQMSRSGFSGRWTLQCYALGSTIAGMNWRPKPGDSEGEAFLQKRGQIDAWWSRYVQAVVQVMQKAPQTTATIITNDGFDKLGIRLGPGTYRQMGSVQSRVQVGNLYPEQ
jgi:hypothetical protein